MSRPAFAWARSSSARLAVAVTASFLLAFVLLGAGVYFAVSTLLTNDAREVIRADAGGLLQLYHEGGRKDLLDEVRDRAEAPDDPDAEYAIVARNGHIEAGTFSRLPRAIAREPRWIELRDRNPDDGSTSRVVAYLQPLRDGEVLVTGLQTRSQDRFLALMLRTALVGLFVATTLGGLIGWLTARWVAGRLRSLDETAAQVGAGELRLRARLDGSDDAFDRLARRFNGMLDRIGELLDGVRHATDHIAHDLRTPLTRLRNRLDRMRREWTLADPAQGRMLDAAINETDQILQSFGALLRLARIEAQPPPDACEGVDLRQLVGDAIELYAPIAAERRITFDCTTPAAQVRGDADQLFQLLVNLLDNAVKFAPAGSVVEVCVRPIPQAVELDVADRGSGIDECDRERVFDRFARLEAHRASPGTGLGLSLARAIVLRHEGRIALLDNGPGLRVRVTLHAA
ncbi:sensor histidine kinase [Cognatiluteimonas profundi]|uniref:sensor histidine kinase n=1 Tax=Cognatiluteimonas profundi TaxID=2594501 RepID=UPI00131DFB95|nr:sensor histidine kinase [Lysobacter profundi]